MCHQPGNRLDSKSLRMEHQMGCVAPITDADYYVGFEPSIVPFLFLGGLEIYCTGIDAYLFQPSEEQVSLSCKSSR